jgi:hypothetical protein
MSLQSMTQHLFCALGAFASAQMLTSLGGEAAVTGGCAERGADQVVAPLVGMEHVSLIAIASMLVLPWIIRGVERGVKARAKEEASSGGTAAAAAS